jgi:adenylosuccinate synthase
MKKSRFLYLHPEANEGGAHLQELGVPDCFHRVTIEDQALITTPYHVAINRARERIRENKHGSCGMGVGETVAYSIMHPESALRAGHLSGRSKELLNRVRYIRRHALKELLTIAKGAHMSLVREECEFLQDDRASRDLAELYANFSWSSGVKIVDSTYLSKILDSGTVIFEGAQGVLLDEEWGFHPYTTWSDCTFGNAHQLLKQCDYQGEVTRMAVLRAYHTRHGAGPFPTEDKDLSYLERHNGFGEWQGSFRRGYFDFLLAHYARRVLGGVDEVALTHLDQVQGPQKVCIGYKWDQSDTKGLFQRKIHPVSREAYEKLLTLCEVEGMPYFHPFGDGSITPVFTTLPSVDRLISGVSTAMQAPITIRSYGPTSEDKH